MSKLTLTIECCTEDFVAELQVKRDEKVVYDLTELDHAEQNAIRGTLRAYIELLDRIRI